MAAALGTAALALALPAVAGAADAPQSCYGSIARIKPDAERDTGVRYKFVCGQAVKAFSIATNVQTASFDVAADVFDPPESGGGIRGDDRFGECEGDLPGWGFTCSGTYGGFGRIVTATFDGMSDPCARDLTRHLVLRASLIVENANGKLSGPYDLGKPSGCPKPAKAVKKKVAKTQSHKSSRR